MLGRTQPHRYRVFTPLLAAPKSENLLLIEFMNTPNPKDLSHDQMAQHHDFHWRWMAGLHPIAGRPKVNHALIMKQNRSFLKKKQDSLSSGPSTAALWLQQNETAFAPSADGVARKVNRSYVNQALQPFREVQRWLAAEAKLIAEHNLLQVRAFHRRNY